LYCIDTIWYMHTDAEFVHNAIKDTVHTPSEDL
jgi:hypothetical protein